MSFINKFLRNDWADWAEILIFNHRLSGLNRFSLMGKPLLGFILITRMRASHGSCNHPDGLSPRKRKSAESVIIGINKSVKSDKSVVLLLASVFCLRQTQVFTSEPIFLFFLFNQVLESFAPSTFGYLPQWSTFFYADSRYNKKLLTNRQQFMLSS